MSFDSDERSIALSRPREVWIVTNPATVYRRTTAEVTFTIGGNTYIAIPGARSDAAASSVNDPPSMDLTLPMTDDIVQDHAFGMPPMSLYVEIYRYQGAASIRIWKGKIISFSVKGDLATIHSVSQLGAELDTNIPSAHVQRQCNHVLYDDRCTINRNTAANKKSTTVSSISLDGMTITVASVGSIGTKLQSGEIVAGDERRMIMKVTGNALEISAPFRDINGGDAVDLFRGCKRTLGDCIASFSNAVNFGGHPHMPIVNPFKGDIRGNPFS